MVTLFARLVILLRDEFSGQLIDSGECRFCIDGRYHRPLRKTEGYYVFGDVPSEPFSLKIICAGYAAQTVAINPRELDPRSPVMTIRLLRSYPAFRGCEWAHGEQLAPGEAFFVRFSGETLKLQAFSEQNGQPLVGILGYPEKPLEAIRCLVGEGDEMETFVFTHKQSDGLYAIDAPLKHQHRAGEAITRISIGISDSGGSCHIPAEAGREGKIEPLRGDWEGGCAWGCLSVTGRCLPVALEWLPQH